jgi:hypothetical protein
MADELAGFPSRELGINPQTGKKGSNQLLRGNSHADQSTKGPRANRVQSRQTPRTSGPKVGKPTAVNPIGAGSSNSLNG